jgi:hypothetical protein
MNQAFLIVAHKQPEQLAMLIKQLQHDSSFFYVHIDAKSNINNFIAHTAALKNITYLHNRYNLNWGGFGIIRASIALMKALEASGVEYSHAHILSGEDISLKSPDQVMGFFSENPGINYINYNKLPFNRWAHGGMDRISRYYFGQNNRNAKKITLRLLHGLNVIINDLLPRLIPALRKRTNLFATFYGGDGWWSLNKHTVGWLLRYFEHHPGVLRFFNTVYIPFECTFHTILMNSELKDTVCNDNKRYIDWSRSKKGSPTVFDENDFIILKESGKYFSRKIHFIKGRRLYEWLIQ